MIDLFLWFQCSNSFAQTSITSCSLDYRMLNGVHSFWMVLTSVFDYISFTCVDHIFLWLINIYSLFSFLKGQIWIISHLYTTATHWIYWLQWNGLQYSFRTSLDYIIIQKQIWFFWSLGGHLCLTFFFRMSDYLSRTVGYSYTHLLWIFFYTKWRKDLF